jgi:hypothetical protein
MFNAGALAIRSSVPAIAKNLHFNFPEGVLTDKPLPLKLFIDITNGLRRTSIGGFLVPDHKPDNSIYSGFIL